ncbi:MAG: sugar phosphate isomerase/epimerase [Clostridia bacterium]|nr:sugar phosphate isomerase/epimerase [Clostridia bacterium]
MIGISTSCFYPMNTEDALLTVAKQGVKVTEVFLNSHSECTGELLEQLVTIKNDYDMQINSIHPYFTFAEKQLLFSQYERRIEDGLCFYRELFDTCDALDCRILVLHGDFNPFRISDEEYLRRFEILVKEAHDRGIIVSQENVVNYRSASVEFLKKEREYLGDLFKMTIDIKQAVRSSVDPMEIAREFGDCAVNVHISDHNTESDCIPPLEGNFDFTKFFKILDNCGYNGNFIIELYRSGFKNADHLINSYKNITKFYKNGCKK